MSSFELVWYILGLPLAGFLCQALLGGWIVNKLGPRWGRWICGVLAVLPIATAFAIGVLITRDLVALDPAVRTHNFTLFNWIELQSLHIPFEVVIDPLSMTMVLVVTGVGALIHLYATGYMAEEKDYPRFFTYLNLFIAFMLILVLGGNLALLFIGWEGVGLCSYLLIGFWYKDIQNARAANKAFIVNRIGDWGMTLGMFLLACVVAAGANQAIQQGKPNWLSYDVALPIAVEILKNNPLLAMAIALLLFVGAMGKSAQFPLYIWLPDAMAGPTPVSALIHAATMVTAGVFLLNRVHVLFELSPIAGAVVVIIGAITALMAALIAFGQTDIKKVLAFSTVSQLGYMFIACGAGAFWAGMFHVVTHAFFKALLFLGSGAVIHAMVHEQDMRRYGGLWKWIKITAATMIIGWLAIAGIPGLAGFFSKEAILGAALGNHFSAEIFGRPASFWAGWVGLLVAALTAAYMTRMTMLTFFGGKEQWRLEPAPAATHHAHTSHPSHETHGAHDHGPDEHGFFYTNGELTERESHEEHEHHHELTPEHKPHEVPISMWFPLVVLAVLSIVGGYLLNQHQLLLNWLYPKGLTLLSEEVVNGHPHGIPLEALSIGAALFGVLIALIYYWKGLPVAEGFDLKKWSGLRKAMAEQFGFDNAIMDMGEVGGRTIAIGFWKAFDKLFIDGIVDGLGALAKKLGEGLRELQTGFVRGYALMMLLGGFALLGAFWWLATRFGGWGQ